MRVDVVTAWLSRTIKLARAGRLLSAVGLLVGGVFVVFVYFWIFYFVLGFVTSSFHPFSHKVSMVISGVVVLLVVATGMKARLSDLDPLAGQVQRAKDMDIRLTPISRYGIGLETDAMSAGAFEFQSMVAAGVFLLHLGPRMIYCSIGAFRRYRRLSALDVQDCARVIALLAHYGQRRSYEEILAELPGLNPVKVFGDLREIEGVLFLQTEPAGLSLTEELKQELRASKS